MRSKNFWNDPKNVDKINTISQNRKSRKPLSGRETSRYDHTIYEFTHDSGIIEHCTRQELVKKYNLDQSSLTNHIQGNYKSTKGWRVTRK